MRFPPQNCESQKGYAARPGRQPEAGQGGSLADPMAISQPARTPAILLGFHRGGTTFVQRLLNCHRQVMIWGENRGMIAALRRLHHDLQEWVSKVDAAEFCEFGSFAGTFDPKVSPVDADDVLHRMTSLVESLYRTDVPHTVWGFKEIRHCNKPDITFLKHLLPDARLVLLVRDPADVLMSDFRGAWSSARSKRESEYVKEFTGSYIRGVRAFMLAREKWPDDVQVVRYEDFRDKDELCHVLRWLKLSEDELNLSLVDNVRDAKVGSSYSDVGRQISSREVRSVRRHFQRDFAAAFNDLELSGPAQSIREWYPDSF